MQTSGVHYLLQKEYLEKPTMRTFYQMVKNQMHKKEWSGPLNGLHEKEDGLPIKPLSTNSNIYHSFYRAF